MLVLGVTAFGAVFLASSPVSAQEAPLRLVFLKSDPDDGNQTYNTLKGVLENSDDIQLIPSRRLLAEARNQGISLDTFRTSEKRINAADQFMRAMSASQVEAVIVYDIFGGGRTVQLVAIGPWGSELSDVRERVSRPVSDSEALQLFTEAFSMLIPQVRAYRAEKEDEMARQQRMENENLEEDLMGEPQEEKTLKDEVVDEQRKSHGNLEEGFNFRLGAIAGHRMMEVTTTADFTLDHSTPLVGIAGRADTIFSVFSGETQAIGASLWGQFAPFLTTFNTGDGNVQEFPGQFVNFGLDLDYFNGLSESFVLHGKFGAEISSLRIEPNQFYTGNRYINLRLGVGGMFRVADVLDIDLVVLALPETVTELSGTDFGSGDFKVGIGADATVDLRIADPFLLSLHYGLRYYTANYRTPNVIDAPASTTDIMNMANFMAGYRF